MTFGAKFFSEVTEVTLKTPETSKESNFVDMGAKNWPVLSDL